jgi:small subunit ribosomal protein S6
MAKLNEKYETMVVYSLKNGEEQIEGLKQKFTSLIEDNATLVSVNEWGKRRLAYPINYEPDGYYVLYGFDCKPDFPLELERVLGITEGILRFLTVLRLDAPAKPAPADQAEQVEAEEPAQAEEAPKAAEEPGEE